MQKPRHRRPCGKQQHARVGVGRRGGGGQAAIARVDEVERVEGVAVGVIVSSSEHLSLKQIQLGRDFIHVGVVSIVFRRRDPINVGSVLNVNPTLMVPSRAV